MDVLHEAHGVWFIWDDDKAAGNPQRHAGVTFMQATEAFFDPFVRVTDASRNGEARDKIIGYDAGNHLLAVVHCVLGDDAIRIVSAWPASAEERRFYDS